MFDFIKKFLKVKKGKKETETYIKEAENTTDETTSKESKKAKTTETVNNHSHGVIDTFGLGVFSDFLKNYIHEKDRKENAKDVHRILSNSATPTNEYYVLMFLSSVIATAGLLQGSAATVIGAMIVAPLMTPLLAFSLATVWGDFRMLIRSIWSIIRGVGIAVIIGFIIAFIFPGQNLSNEIIMRTHPGIFDILIAFASGIAGAYAYLDRKIIAVLPGVAIAVALVPPLCVIGVGLGRFQLSVALGATILFIINLSAVLLASVVVFFVKKVYIERNEEEVKERTYIHMILTGIVFVIVAIPAIYYSIKKIYIEDMQNDLNKFVSKVIKPDSLSHSILIENDKKLVYEITISGSHPPHDSILSIIKNYYQIRTDNRKENIIRIKFKKEEILK